MKTVKNKDHNQATSSKHAIQQNLEKQFEMLNYEEAPEDLKEEVFNTLDTLNLFADLMDLFTIKFSLTEAEVIDATGLQEEEE